MTKEVSHQAAKSMRYKFQKSFSRDLEIA